MQTSKWIEPVHLVWMLIVPLALVVSDASVATWLLFLESCLEHN